MRKIIVAALAAIAPLCLAAPVYAQTSVVTFSGRGPYTNSGTLTTTNDAVTADLNGSMWATARWTVTTAGTATVTTEVSLDGGTNWLASAYSRNISAVSTNPSTVPWANNGPVVGTYDTPLPGNATNFRVRCGASGTATVVTVGAGVTYVPGVPVLATLSDVTEGGIGAGIGTSTTPLEVSGWSTLTVTGVSPTGQAVTLRPLDDAGSAIANTLLSMTAASTGILSLSHVGGHAGVNTVGVGNYTAAVLTARRIAVYLPAGGTVSTGRIRIEASR